MISDAYLWLYIQYTRLRLWYYAAALESMMHNDPLHSDTASLALHVYHLREFIRNAK